MGLVVGHGERRHRSRLDAQGTFQPIGAAEREAAGCAKAVMMSFGSGTHRPGIADV
jgi:hypothetical protein